MSNLLGQPHKLAKMSGPLVTLPDGHSDYECFVSAIQKDFELRVETVQASAEENTKRYEAYCSELKTQLQESKACVQQLKAHNKQLEQQLEACGKQLEECRAQMVEQQACNQAERKKLEDKMEKKEELERKCEAASLWNAMTSVTVSLVERLDGNIVYTCEVDDGEIAGHKFHLTLNTSEGEYTYQPLSSVLFSTRDIDLNVPTTFPDYMISRFLYNLLSITHP